MARWFSSVTERLRPRSGGGDQPVIALSGESSRRHDIRPSLFLRGAVLFFALVAGVSVFQCLAPRVGFADALIASLSVTAALVTVAYRSERRQPVAFQIGPDGLATWDRSGAAHYRQITGCAQWSGRLIALVLLEPGGRSTPFLLAADATIAHAFRELAVRGRRCAQGHL
jgi:hypothetical protein